MAQVINIECAVFGTVSKSIDHLPQDEGSVADIEPDDQLDGVEHGSSIDVAGLTTASSDQSSDMAMTAASFYGRQKKQTVSTRKKCIPSRLLD